MKYIIGIDEAGRGPLAGPVAVGAAVVPVDFAWLEVLPGVTDSKKISPKKRAEVLRTATLLRHRGLINFTVAMVSASVIDREGIVPAINIAMKRALARLAPPVSRSFIRLDGSLYAPEQFAQATIIKGDALYPEIGLASIAAKETRDAYMRRVDKRWPGYGFADHSGYGTVAHRAAIQARGLSPIHRAMYCQNALRGVR
jgi:ribonuclease HII